MAEPIEGAKPEDFRVVRMNESGGSIWTGQHLRQIKHVTHLSHAIKIAESNKLEPRLVYDKSKLNDTRIQVIWLSPNDWTTGPNRPGSRYGQIEFTFNWDFHANRKAYWVEAISYDPVAPRILLAKEGNLPEGLKLSEYDPSRNVGPWEIRDGEHRWNGKNCLEIMLQDEIPTEQILRVRFVKHHSEYCSINRENPENCRDRKRAPNLTGALFVGVLVGSNIHSVDHALVKKSQSGKTVPSEPLSRAAQELKKLLKVKYEGGGSLKAKNAAAGTIIRSLFAMFRGRKEDCQILLDQFESTNEATEAAMQAIADHFNIDRGSLAET